MFVPSGHHRQPRNTGALLDLAPAAGADVPNPGSYTPPFFPQLPYTLAGGNGLAKLLFWSVTDGANGEVLPPTALTQTVGALPLQIGAWYFPISGPGGVGNGSAVIVDAFSAALGGFIDDTFVDVTSHPTLTNGANVVGVVPTKSAETLQAKANVISTPEPFSQWVMNDAVMPVGNSTLNVPQGTSGIAVAIYQRPKTLIPKLPNDAFYNLWWWIETHGGLVPPGPGPQWLAALAPLFALARAASGMSRQLQIETLQTGLKQLSNVANAVKAEIKSLEKKK
jgi:hypothetical protein